MLVLVKDERIKKPFPKIYKEQSFSQKEAMMTMNKRPINRWGIFLLMILTGAVLLGCAGEEIVQGQDITDVQEEITIPEAENSPPAGSAPLAQREEDSLETEQDAQTTTGTSSESTTTIEITPTGFSPQTIRIQAGQEVTFVNRDVRQHWPASAIHPTHQAYPDSDIQKCGTAKQAQIFDACKGLQRGESWTFTFTEQGSWRYHDHLRPSFTGVIEVGG